MRSFFLLLFLLLSLSSCSGDLEKYALIKVLDGDTVLVIDSRCHEYIEVEGLNCKAQKVRLIGIDAPEYDQEPWGKRALSYLESVLIDKAAKSNNHVYLEYSIEKRDKYNRLLAYVYNEKGALANKLLLEQGYAELFTFAKNKEHLLEFKKAEAQARKAQLNIWHKIDGLKMRPYEYRKKHKKEKK